MNTEQPLLAFFGHHKCATKYILAILKQICRDCGLKLMTVSSVKNVGEDLQSLISRSAAEFLAHMNSQWVHVAQLNNMRGFHVIRDPRDVLTSAYFSHLHSHETREWPELTAHRERLRTLDKAGGLMLEMDFSAPVFQAMLEWNYDDSRILEIRFERLTSDPYQTFLQIFEHLGLLRDDTSRVSRLLFQVKSTINRSYGFGTGPLPIRWPTHWVSAERILAAVYDNRFSKRTGGRNRGEEDVKHHFRKGVPGDWKNHFSNDHVREFNRRYGDLLEKIGYAAAAAATAAA